MAHTITSAVAAVFRCKAKAGFMRSPWCLHTYTIVITADIQSGFVAEDYLVKFRCSPGLSSVAQIQLEESMGGRQGQHVYLACFAYQSLNTIGG
ncbi:hypothetical protein TNCV_2234281 [Trichonephila clavipes]|nr:hypothetical protein TNCV_2234281 [Trichonephila clavipes]